MRGERTVAGLLAQRPLVQRWLMIGRFSFCARSGVALSGGNIDRRDDVQELAGDIPPE